MSRRGATPLCHCGELDTGVEHWSRCIVCHPEQYLGMVRSDRMVGWCELHRRTGAQCIAVAIYAGIVALGEWARRQDAKHAARAFVATQPGYECACCGGSGIRPASGDHVVVCDCGAEHPLPKSVDAILCGWTSQQGVASVMLGAIALGEWARRCAVGQLDECCAACWMLGDDGPCRRHRR